MSEALSAGGPTAVVGVDGEGAPDDDNKDASPTSAPGPCLTPPSSGDEEQSERRTNDTTTDTTNEGLPRTRLPSTQQQEGQPVQPGQAGQTSQIDRPEQQHGMPVQSEGAEELVQPPAPWRRKNEPCTDPDCDLCNVIKCVQDSSCIFCLKQLKEGGCHLPECRYGHVNLTDVPRPFCPTFWFCNFCRFYRDENQGYGGQRGQQRRNVTRCTKIHVSRKLGNLLLPGVSHKMRLDQESVKKALLCYEPVLQREGWMTEAARLAFQRINVDVHTGASPSPPGAQSAAYEADAGRGAGFG